MKLHQHTTYKRTPHSCPDVEAIQFSKFDPESGPKIVRWIENLRGLGAALYEDHDLIIPAEEFGGLFHVPEGWVVYREGLDVRFHVAPYEIFHYRYEVKK